MGVDTRSGLGTKFQVFYSISFIFASLFNGVLTLEGKI